MSHRNPYHHYYSNPFSLSSRPPLTLLAQEESKLVFYCGVFFGNFYISYDEVLIVLLSRRKRLRELICILLVRYMTRLWGLFLNLERERNFNFNDKAIWWKLIFFYAYFDNSDSKREFDRVFFVFCLFVWCHIEIYEFLNTNVIIIEEL